MKILNFSFYLTFLLSDFSVAKFAGVFDVRRNTSKSKPIFVRRSINFRDLLRKENYLLNFEGWGYFSEFPSVNNCKCCIS